MTVTFSSTEDRGTKSLNLCARISVCVCASERASHWVSVPASVCEVLIVRETAREREDDGGEAVSTADPGERERGQ